MIQTQPMQDFAARLKAGDKVDVTFARSIAVAGLPGAVVFGLEIGLCTIGIAPTALRCGGALQRDATSASTF